MILYYTFRQQTLFFHFAPVSLKILKIIATFVFRSTEYVDIIVLFYLVYLPLPLSYIPELFGQFRTWRIEHSILRLPTQLNTLSVYRDYRA